MKLKKSLLALAMSAATATTFAGEVEVLHYWTSGGEAAAVGELKQMVEQKGHTWKDFAVAGGGGENAMTVLRSRAVANQAPAAAQIKGLTIQEYGDYGFLANIDAIAGDWDKVLPSVVADVMKYDGHYVAAPVNVHRVNWMWANPDIFREVGVAIPTTWEAFLEAADAIQAAGYTAVAHGGQAWQDATVFEGVALAVGGPDFYTKAFVEHDSATLTSATMVKVFEEFGKIRKYLDKGFPGRDWNLATSMVINGEAAMQFMGDWAKGEFTVAGKNPGTDYVCLPFPGTESAFTFNIDSLAMFNQRSKDNQKAQLDMASLVLSPEFQEGFNLRKGSIPARTDLDMSAFDSCAHRSMADFKATAASTGLVPSMAHGMSTTSSIQGAIYDTVTAYFNDSSMSAKDAVNKLSRAVKAAM